MKEGRNGREGFLASEDEASRPVARNLDDFAIVARSDVGPCVRWVRQRRGHAGDLDRAVEPSLKPRDQKAELKSALTAGDLMEFIDNDCPDASVGRMLSNKRVIEALGS